MTEKGSSRRGSTRTALFVVLVLLAGCSTNSTRAPVEDRVATSPPSVAPGEPAKPLPGAENEGKPGYYTVRRGDTLIRIGLDSGQNWRDLVRWNNLENPNAIEVGQVLRIVPPTGPVALATPPERGSAAVRPNTPASAAAGAAATPPLSPPLTAGADATSTKATNGAASNAPAATGNGNSSNSNSGGAADDEPRFIWPTSGALLAGFDEQRNKGLDIGGRPGEPVVAAADGRVVYAGAGLRGYGNLIILKHNNTFLTAYAHNRSLLVKEDQSVQKGQKIAEMGDSDADRVKLHFEIRRQGKPVDPTRYLPPR